MYPSNATVVAKSRPIVTERLITITLVSVVVSASVVLTAVVHSDVDRIVVLIGSEVKTGVVKEAVVVMDSILWV